jgi:hypothetical protein
MAETPRARSTADLSASVDLQADADDDDVDRASHHRRGALISAPHAGAGGWSRPASGPTAYAKVQVVHGIDHRTGDPVRLHLGAGPSHVRRHPPFHLGHRPRLWRTEREWLVRAGLAGSIATTIISGSSATR